MSTTNETTPELFERVSQLSKPEQTDEEYLVALAMHMMELTAAESLWILECSEEGCSLGFTHPEHAPDVRRLFNELPEFAQCLEMLLEQKQTLVLPITEVPNDPSDDESVTPSEETFQNSEANPICLFLAPTFHQEQSGVVICLQSRQIPLDIAPMVAEQLTGLAFSGPIRNLEIAAGKLKEAQEETNHQLSETVAAGEATKRALSLGNHITGSVEKEKTGFLLANELKNYLAVDRVTMLETIGNRVKVLAVSGQLIINKRANLIRSTQQLGKMLLAAKEPVWFDGDIGKFAEPARVAINRYLEESMAQGFALLPIEESTAPVFASDKESLIDIVSPGRTHKKKIRGAILLENIHAPIRQEVVSEQWQHIQPLVTSQFNNAKRYSDLFLLPFILLMTKFVALYRGHTKRIAYGITGAIVLALVLGIFIKSDFRVRCEGHLQPQQAFKVFVKKGGVVTRVLVKEGQEVKADQVLLELVNPQLELELASLQGEREDKAQKLKAFVFERTTFQSAASSPEHKQHYDQLSKQTGLLQNGVNVLDQKIALANEQMEQLVIRAPFDGVVIGWNIDRKYLNRPLEQGIRLLTVADPDRGRMLELKVPDKRSGHIQVAHELEEQAGNALAVEFTVTSLPGERFDGHIVHVSPGLEKDTDLGYVLPVEAVPDDELPAHLRAGLPVSAKIVCGKRSLLYCKSYEFVDWFNRFRFSYLY